MGEHWRPDDRYTVIGVEWRLVTPFGGNPATHFISDYTLVTEWIVEEVPTGKLWVVTSDFLAGAAGLQRCDPD